MALNVRLIFGTIIALHLLLVIVMVRFAPTKVELIDKAADELRRYFEGAPHMSTASATMDHLNIDNKKNSNLSLAISVAAHALLVVGIKYGYLFSLNTAAPVEETYIDLGYQSFDEVPEAKPVITKSEEIQDSQGEVQSLQKEKSTDTSAPSDRPTYADVPYYKIKPKYPKDALEAGIEGNVRMTVDILEDGTVENVKVIGGEKVGTFESAAMRSVAKWKYKPFTDANGNPIKKTNYMVQVDFKIKDEIANN